MVTISQSPAAVISPPVAQPVLTPLTASAVILVLTIDDGGEPEVQSLLADLSGLARTVGLRSSQGGLAVVAGIGSVAWDRLFAGPRPADLHAFAALDGGRHQAVATSGDLLFHIRAATMDLCWELASLIGRAKLSNVEMGDDVKPPNSHVALNTIIEPDGTQRQILRDNMPFGSLGAGEFGTYFIGYAATPSVTELMLRHMFVGDPPGNYDRILDFSTAVTGALFFIPTADFLDDPPPLPVEAGRSTTAGSRVDGAGQEGTGSSNPGSAGDGSLGIGGLKGE